MPRTKMHQQGEFNLSDKISLSILQKYVPLSIVKEVLRENGKLSKRHREFPYHVVVYYVMAMALYMHVNLKEVLRSLVECCNWLFEGVETIKIIGKSGISQARSRLGKDSLLQLYHKIVKPIGQEGSSCFYKNLRLVSIDGSTLDVADEQSNVEAFGYPGVSQGKAAFPQVRLVGLVENGSHVLFGVHVDKFLVGEQTIAKQVVKHLEKQMLCIADRLFYSYELWQLANSTGAELLWRVKSSMLLEPEESLEDGSYLSTIYPNPKARRHKKDGVKVRVIEYTLSENKDITYRLITTILDDKLAPAEDLAKLYYGRWEFETALDEFKTHLRGKQIVLRSKQPELVLQEIYGLLLTHFVIRSIMYEAALVHRREVLNLSFTHAINVLRRKLPVSLTVSP